MLISLAMIKSMAKYFDIDSDEPVVTSDKGQLG